MILKTLFRHQKKTFDALCKFKKCIIRVYLCHGKKTQFLKVWKKKKHIKYEARKCNKTQ